MPDTPPESIDYLARLARTGGVPGARSAAGYAPTAAAPGALSVAAYAPTTVAPQLSDLDGTVSLLPNMPSNFPPAFVELVTGDRSISSLSVNALDLGRILQGTVAGRLKSYQVRAGTDAQALPGIVRPANFHADTNALVFVQL